MFEAVWTRVLQSVFGGGSSISAANPIPVDTSPGAKTATEVLDEATIALGVTTVLADCAAIDLSGGVTTLVITIEATYNAAAIAGVKVYVRTSYDNTNYDTEDWDEWTAEFGAGTTIRQTKNYDTGPMYVKILVENLDLAQAVTNVKVIATVGA